MKTLFFSFFILLNFTLQMNAQNQPLAIKKYGNITLYDSVAVAPSKNETHKILYRVTQSIEKQGVNKELWHVARLFNLLKAYNVPTENIHIVVVISGKGYSTALNNKAHLNYFEKENPNLELIDELIKNNVEIHICGQTVAGNHLDYNKDINPKIKLTLSAMIDVVEYGKKGYVIFQ